MAGIDGDSFLKGFGNSQRLRYKMSLTSLKDLDERTERNLLRWPRHEQLHVYNLKNSKGPAKGDFMVACYGCFQTADSKLYNLCPLMPELMLITRMKSKRFSSILSPEHVIERLLVFKGNFKVHANI